MNSDQLFLILALSCRDYLENQEKEESQAETGGTAIQEVVVSLEKGAEMETLAEMLVTFVIVLCILYDLLIAILRNSIDSKAVNLYHEK